MLGFDVFDGDAFSMQTLTDMVNHQPYVPGFLGEQGLFEERGITTTKASVRERNGVLAYIPTASRSANPAQHDHQKDVMRDFRIPHIPYQDVITADEFQDVINSANTESAQLQSLEQEVADRTLEMNNNMEVTAEHLRMGAVQGILYDADGSTVIYNLFTEFEITPYTTINFDLDNATPASGALMTLCNQVHRQMSDALGGAPYERVVALVGDTFFDQLTAHPEYRAAYDRPQDGKFIRTSFAYKQVEYGNIVFINYRGAVGGASMVATTAAHFYPVGARGAFKTWYAPANVLSEVNRIGRPRFASTFRDPRDKYVEINMQANPLPICVKPKCLFDGINT